VQMGHCSGAGSQAKQQIPPLIGLTRPLSLWRGGQFFARTLLKENDMQINLTGHHVEITPALRDYVNDKLQRISRHFDHVISINVVLKVEKHNNDAEATLHAAGKSLFANASDLDMYAAIDGLVDKLDKQVKRYKERLREHQASRDDRSVSLE
jgi:putative sigma-54 modulation protein